MEVDGSKVSDVEEACVGLLRPTTHASPARTGTVR